MTAQALNNHHGQHHDHSHDASSRVIFGFWLFLMTDFIVFACLFATYDVLHNNTFGGPGIKQIASLSYVLVQTLFLLTSSLTYGFAHIAQRKGRGSVMFWLTVTFLLGLAFVGFEFHEFANLIATGNSWQRSAFLSAFFTLVGIHGIHIVVGMLWIVILMIQMTKQNLSPTMRTRLTCLGMFWNFLDIVWIFIFTIVYLMGAM